jgi:hypothetical protein
MSRSRESARQTAAVDAGEWLRKSRTIGDFAWQVVTGLDGLRGEERVGACIGIVNAIETLAYRENE